MKACVSHPHRTTPRHGSIQDRAIGQVLAEYFIGANKFIGGSSPSIADMAIAPTLYFLQVAKYEASQNTRKRKATGVRTHQPVRGRTLLRGFEAGAAPCCCAGVCVAMGRWHISRTLARLRAAHCNHSIGDTKVCLLLQMQMLQFCDRSCT